MKILKSNFKSLEEAYEERARGQRELVRLFETSYRQDILNDIAELNSIIAHMETPNYESDCICDIVNAMINGESRSYVLDLIHSCGFTNVVYDEKNDFYKVK